MSNQIQNPNIKLSLVFIIVLIVLILGSSFWVAHAQGDKLSKPGITPASRFYFLDEWIEKIVYWFTIGVENKAGRLLEFAEEKLAETRELLEENEVSYAEKARDKYEEYLDRAQGLAKKAKDEGDIGLADKLIDLITQKTLKYQGVLAEDFSENLPEKLPEGVQGIILNMLDLTKEGFRKALEAISTREKRNEIFERFEDLKIEIDKKLEIIRENIKDTGIPLR